MLWRVMVESLPDATRSNTDAAAVRAMLAAMTAVADPTCRVDAQTGVIWAVFSVDALHRAEAGRVSHLAYASALERCGISPLVSLDDMRVVVEAGQSDLLPAGRCGQREWTRR